MRCRWRKHEAWRRWAHLILVGSPQSSVNWICVAILFAVSQLAVLRYFVHLESERYRLDEDLFSSLQSETGRSIDNFYKELERKEAHRLHELKITPRSVNFTSGISEDDDTPKPFDNGAFVFFLGPAGGWGGAEAYPSVVESVKVAIYSLSKTNPRYPIVLLITEGIWDTLEWKECPELVEWLLPAIPTHGRGGERVKGVAEQQIDAGSQSEERLRGGGGGGDGEERPFMVQIVPDVIKLLQDRQEAELMLLDQEKEADNNHNNNNHNNNEKEDKEEQVARWEKNYPFLHHKLSINGLLRKLAIWAIEGFEKVVFLDADTLIVQNIDILMTAEPTPAFKIDHRAGDIFRFNSGVGVIRPGKNREVFNDMMNKIPFLPSYDGSDQGWLNSYFNGSWYQLPERFNVYKQCKQKDTRESLNSYSVLHFFGLKPPYCISRTRDCNPLLRFHSHFWHRLWWEYYEGMIEDKFFGRHEFRCSAWLGPAAYRDLWEYTDFHETLDKAGVDKEVIEADKERGRWSMVATRTKRGAVKNFAVSGPAWC